jgi:drug/metabolite transporter (DMT)-like permease
MSARVLRVLDPLALLAAVISVVMAAVYVEVMRAQDDRPLAWVLVVLCMCALLAAYGAWLSAPHRRAGLIVAGVGLMLVGLLAILTIGLPILLAGALALWGSARQARVTSQARLE